MNVDINLMHTRTFHPVRVNSDEIHALALWLKAHGSRQVRQPPNLFSVMSERYPAGLFSDEEMHALCELMNN